MTSSTRYYSALRASTGTVYQAADTELQDMDHSRMLRPASEASGSQSNFTTACSNEEENEPLRKHDSQGWQAQASPKMTVPPHRSKPQAMLELLAKLPYLKRLQNLSGWRIGAAVSATLATAVLFTNVLLTLWASISFGVTNGIGTAYEGDCDTVKRWSLGLHILINGLSSALLGASNYTMQCASAPTRKECDKAHEQGDWLDIGVVSVRNLTRIGWRRRLIWAALAFSSLPIHLIYNSTVFTTLDANVYNVAVVSPELLYLWNLTASPGGHREYQDDVQQVHSTYLNNTWSAQWETPNLRKVYDAYVANASAFEKLDPERCQATYGRPFVSGHKHLVAVTSPTGNATLFYTWSPSQVYPDGGEIPWEWICFDDDDDELDSTCGTADYQLDTNWTLVNKMVDHCLAQTTERHCQLQFSLYMLVVVIVCNLAKLASMLAILWQQREAIFVVWGDAMSSWLDNPDGNTEGRCLLSKKMITSRNPCLSGSRHVLHRGRLTHRALHGTSRTRWYVTSCVYIISLVAVAGLLSLALRWAGSDILKSVAFGAVDSRTLPDLDIGSDLTKMVLVANSPQVVLSVTYLLFNGLFTGMHLVREYGDYEVQRKGLRVTMPRGEQRSTYWLQLPYAYSIPLITASATLHWLISQSIFLVRVSYNSDDPGEGPTEADITSLGISPVAILSVLVVGTCLLLVAIGFGFRKIGSNMPIAGSCSLALAAAAHRPAADSDASVRPVMWGEVPEMGNEEVGHCCFTSQEVVEPQMGRMYAGVDSTTLRRRV